MSETGQSNRTALVIGAGIVGVSCALALARRGISVTLVDRDEPGVQCSFGNAGRIASASCAPRSTPGFLRKVPGMLRTPWHPLKVSPAHLIRAFPWFRDFLRSGRKDRVEATADAIHALCGRADEAFDELVHFAGAKDLVRRNGLLYGYADRANFEAARAGIEYSTKRGFVVEELTGEEAREMEPGLPASVCAAFHRPDEALVINPLALTQRLVSRFVELGGKFERAEVTGFERTAAVTGADKPPAVITSAGSRTADTVVVATGAWSEAIGKGLGVRVPIQAERGYHAEIVDSGIELNMPIALGDRYLALSPMDGCLRISSGAQFAPVDEAPNWGRLDQVLASARSYYPGMRTAGHTRWMGGRPSTPDSLPVIGASKRHPQVLFACGHGMIGLTLSAITARLVGELAAGEAPSVDLSPYSPDRF